MYTHMPQVLDELLVLELDELVHEVLAGCVSLCV